MLLLIRSAAWLLLAASWPLAAASFTANSSQDLPDDNPGDGVCRSSGVPVSTCTLRAAIMEANALPGNHIIHLQSGRTYTLTRPGVDDTALNGDLDITKSLIVWCLGCGERPVVDADGLDRVFDIRGGNVTLAGFDITGGNPDPSAASQGGGVAVRVSAGTVVLSQMRLYGNQARSGGALHNRGSDTTVSASELFDNHGFGANNFSASAIDNKSSLTLRRSAVHGNSSAVSSYPAVWVEREDINLTAFLTIENSTISGNFGSGLKVTSANYTDINNSTIANNSFRGLAVLGTDSAVNIRNSIIANNTIGDCTLNSPGGLYTSANNLYSDASCASIASAGDLQSTDPLLTPLKYRSGGTVVTPLHWPRQDSPALSAGSTVPIGQPGGCLSVDQIGVPRPQGYNGIVRCDIGAAEVPDDAIFFDSLETL